ncbi:MAG: hypothetical protein ABSG41_27855 [Bryobacteraceae bacterium]|jgi:hypothetical protein
MKQDLHSTGQALHIAEALKDKIDHVRQEAAESLDHAASTVRSTAARGIDAIDNMAEAAATRLDSTAKHIRSYDPLGAVRRVMQRSPGVTLCVGIAAGLLVGLSVRRN